MTQDPTPAATARKRDPMRLAMQTIHDDHHESLVREGWCSECACRWPCHTRRSAARALATAEAPGRVAALEAALVALPVGRYTASRYDTDDLHRLHVWNAEQSWDLDVPRIAAPAPTPSEPVARFTGQDEWPCVCGHVKRRHHFGDTPAIDGSFGAWCQADPMHCVRFTPGARDE